MKLTVTANQLGLSGRQLNCVMSRLEQLKPSAIIHGGCVGGDDQIDQIAADLGIPRYVFPQSRYLNKRVSDLILRSRTGSSVVIMPAIENPLARNRTMVKVGDRLLACPRTAKMTMRSGTWSTVRFARRLNRQVEVIEP